jgi:8-oxo-dGTP pyrophosphatase MutT (NUDIX family)
MSKKKHVEIIARGVCVKDGKILLCFGRKSGIAYLPGGHIDFGESGTQALEREISEEMGLASKAGQFLGCCEHSFVQEGVPHAEVNLVYELDVPELDPAVEPQAVEEWIGFMWHPLETLAEARFEPAALAPRIAEWLTHPGGHLESGY